MGMPHRIDALDGLRAVAVSLVLAEHLAPTYVPGGGFGVDIFFVLSGYLITSLLLREVEETDSISLSRFYLRRAGRLTPALLLVLAVTALVVTLWPIPQFSWVEFWYASTYTMNWARAFGWDQGRLLGHTWSLGIEEQYYLLWPVILLTVLRLKPRWAFRATLGLAGLSVLVGALLYLHGASFDRFYNGLDVRAVELLIGSAIAFTKPHAWAWTFPLAPVLSLAPLVYIGRISYGIYLWHYPVLRLAHAYGLRHIPRDAVVLAVTFTAAALSYHFWEGPIRKRVNARIQDQISGTRQRLRPQSETGQSIS